MKLPVSARIGPYKCKITRVESLVVDGDKCFGSFDYNRHEIAITGEAEFSSDALEASALVHELMHALLHIYKIKVPDEEAMVEILETALIQLLKDNKTLIRSVLKALK